MFEPDPTKVEQCFDFPMHYAAIYRDTDAVRNGDPKHINRDFYGFTPLILAVSNPNTAKYDLLYPAGDTRVLTVTASATLASAALLLERGADVNYANYSGATALHYACQNGGENVELLELLVKHGANVNATDNKGRSPMRHLFYHKGFKQHEATTLLLCHGADPFLYDMRSHTPVEEAVKVFGILSAIVDHGIDLKDERLFMENQSTFLHHACRDATEGEVIDLVVSAGFDVNAPDSHGRTPLHLASCWKANPKHTISALLKHSPNVSLVDNLGRTPLHLLCKDECILKKYFDDTVTLLTEAGVDVNQRDIFGQTPLYVALESRHEYRVKCLIRQGASLTVEDVNRVSLVHYMCLLSTFSEFITSDAVGNDKFGSSLLHYAALSNNITAAKKLIDLGVQVDAQDSQGRTPLDVAVSHGFTAVANLITGEAITIDVYPCTSKCSQLRHTDIEGGDFSAVEQPEDVEVFSKRVLSSPVIGKCQDSPERREITKEITSLLTRLSTEAERCLSFLAFEPKVRGSMAEGTKCGPPDEFDCMIILHGFSTCFTPEIDHRFGKAKYTKMVYNGRDGGTFKKLYPYFVTSNGILNSALMYEFIYEKFSGIFSRSEFWENSRLSFSRFVMTSNFLTVLVKWTGESFKNLEVGVDLVPSIPIRFDSGAYDFSWPLPIDLSDASLYTLLVQSSHDDDLLEVSFTEIEERMMISLPPPAKDAYIFAKGMRSPQISQEFLNFDSFDEDGTPSDPESVLYATPFGAETMIKSYYLKCQLFWLVKDNAQKMDINTIHCHEWTQLIYKNLSEAVERNELLTYIQGHNVFDTMRRRAQRSMFNPVGTIWRLEHLYNPDMIQKTPVKSSDNYIGEVTKDTEQMFPKEMTMPYDVRKQKLTLKVICYILKTI